ncbi:MAG: hypothetical protein KKA22_02150 [Gammaproteobacteria bacterium]|nr:hypothetical protein [Gammaproteobacteria bacterium]MBU1406930.1 hypothetical protein [Gammaproteobacteria bacterium]MBU1533073.1 hypothetical protein [Gammaproteobacteria bacterium]
MIPVRYIVSLAIFSAPLMFFSIGSISAFKILAAFLLLLLIRELIEFKYYFLIGQGSFWSIIVGFMVYNIVVQILFGVFGVVFYGGYASMDSSAPLNRLGAQLFSIALIYALTVYIYRYGRQKQIVVAKPVIIALKLLLIVSAYELVSIFFNLPKVPMYLEVEASEVHQNMSNILGINRINSLAGEPRFYSVILAVAFNSIFFYFAHFYARLGILSKLKYAFLLVFIILLILHTQSTSGLIALSLLLPLTFGLSKGISFSNKVKLIGLIAVIFMSLSPLIVDLVQTRVIERISEEMLSDKYLGTDGAAYVEVPGAGLVSFDATDATPLVLLLDKPFLAITGLGYGNISTYVKPYLPYYSGYWGYGYQGVVEPNMAFLKSILNYGIIGNLILIILYWKFFKHYRTYGCQYSGMQLTSFYALTSVLICSYTVTSPMLVPIWFFAFHAAILDGCSIKSPSAGKAGGAPQ